MSFMNRTGRPAVVLLAEDNEPDQRTVQRGFSKAKLNIRLFIVEDGEECLDFLRHEGKYADAEAYPRPDLLLLDINMPKMDGRQVLRHIRDDEKLRRLPVVILTTSDQERDVVASYENGANAYITKPVEPGRFMETVRRLEEFWFELVVLPQSH
ncbi:MAG: response regulator [Magnetococcales bacterium]|nr:response regulator [Magnetococcales bacterium]